jgi:hypothetical protein
MVRSMAWSVNGDSPPGEIRIDILLDIGFPDFPLRV